MFNALSNVVGYLNAEGYCNANRCHVSSPRSSGTPAPSGHAFSVYYCLQHLQTELYMGSTAEEAWNGWC